MAYEEEYEELDEEYGAGELELVPIEFPADIGECIDKLYVLRAQRLVFEKELRQRKRTEAAYKLHIIGILGELKMEGGKGTTANSSITRKEMPTPDDWNAIYEYIEATQAWDLMQKRLSTKAIQERWDLGEEVPGIGKFEKVDLSLTKVK